MVAPLEKKYSVCRVVGGTTMLQGIDEQVAKGKMMASALSPMRSRWLHHLRETTRLTSATADRRHSRRLRPTVVFDVQMC